MITAVYYTSNKEDERFESVIRQELEKSTGNIPIISVSHKPIDLGRNICVGDVGCSDVNIYQQLLIGCEAATTPLIATAEADCLYPKAGYFDFVPPKIDTAYRFTNLWVIQRGGKGYWKKDYSLCGQVAGREYLIHWIKRRLRKERISGWTTKKMKRKDFFPHNKNFYPMTLPGKPIINIKTNDGLRKKCHTSNIFSESLPYWGSVKELKERLWPNYQF